MICLRNYARNRKMKSPNEIAREIQMVHTNFFGGAKSVSHN